MNLGECFEISFLLSSSLHFLLNCFTFPGALLIFQRIYPLFLASHPILAFSSPQPSMVNAYHSSHLHLHTLPQAVGPTSLLSHSPAAVVPNACYPPSIFFLLTSYLFLKPPLPPQHRLPISFHHVFLSYSPSTISRLRHPYPISSRTIRCDARARWLDDVGDRARVRRRVVPSDAPLAAPRRACVPTPQ